MAAIALEVHNMSYYGMPNSYLALDMYRGIEPSIEYGEHADLALLGRALTIG